MVWGIFSWHTLGPLEPIEHRFNATAYLSIVTDHIHPFMISFYITKLKSSQTGFLNTMSSRYSNGLHSHQIFGMWWNRRFTSWMCSRQIYFCLCDAIMSIWAKISRNVSSTLLNLCHKELKQFWRPKEVQPGTSKVYLIKWPVSVYVYIYIYIYFIFLGYNICQCHYLLTLIYLQFSMVFCPVFQNALGKPVWNKKRFTKNKRQHMGME